MYECREELGAWYQGVKLGPKMGQMGAKCDKSGTFSDHISVHFDSQKSRFSPIWAQPDQLWAQI